MKVGIKYCGGCNPRYDRAAYVKVLCARHPDWDWEYAQRVCYTTCCWWSEAAQAAVRDTTNISTKAYKKYGSRSRKDELFLCAGNIACAASGM